MQIFLSILYPIFIFFALGSLDIHIISMILFGVSLVWFIVALKQEIKNAIIPSFYLAISLFSFFMEEFMVLKLLPLIISIFVMLVFIISFIKKESVIFYFAKKFTKKEFSKEEKEYMHKSTVFWILVNMINVSLHIWAYFSQNINFWLFYSTVGGYLLIAVAGVIQYIHGNFIYKPRVLKRMKKQ